MQVYTQKRQAFEGSKSPKNSPNFVELPKSVVKDSHNNGKWTLPEVLEDGSVLT